MRALLLVLSCWFASPLQAVAQEQPVEDRARAEYAVYSALLDAFGLDRSAREGQPSFGSDIDRLYSAASPRAHLVSDSTRGVLIWGLQRADLILSSLEKLPGLPRELIADYAASNEAPRLLRSEGFTTRIPVTILNAAERRRVNEATMDDSGYPAPLPAPGHLTLSRVGFSPDGTLAALYADFRCGGRCGSGQIVVLEKRNGRWEVRQTETIVRY